MKTGFIYIWYDRKHKRYYVGSHLGTEDDGYICSSTWMKSSYKRRPEDFKRRVLKRGIEKKFLKEQEYKWLQMIKSEELGKRYYNLNNKKILKPGNWPVGKARSEETRRKISESLKGKYFLSDDHRKKASERMKGNKFRKGSSLSSEAKNKVSKSLLGNKRASGVWTSERKKQHSIQMKRYWNTKKNDTCYR